MKQLLNVTTDHSVIVFAASDRSPRVLASNRSKVIIILMRIPVMLRQEDLSCKVVGSNPGTAEGFFIAKWALKWSFRISLPWNLFSVSCIKC